MLLAEFERPWTKDRPNDGLVNGLNLQQLLRQTMNKILLLIDDTPSPLRTNFHDLKDLTIDTILDLFGVLLRILCLGVPYPA